MPLHMSAEVGAAALSGYFFLDHRGREGRKGELVPLRTLRPLWSKEQETGRSSSTDQSFRQPALQYSSGRTSQQPAQAKPQPIRYSTTTGTSIHQQPSSGQRHLDAASEPEP